MRPRLAGFPGTAWHGGRRLRPCRGPGRQESRTSRGPFGTCLWVWNCGSRRSIRVRGPASRPPRLRSTGEGVVAEAIAEVSGQCGPVGQEPRLHALDHQVNVVVVCAGRLVPTVTILQVPPRSGVLCDGPFAVNEQHGKVVVAGRAECMTKVIVCMLPAAGGKNSGQASFEARIQEERPKCLPAPGLGWVSIAASLDVEPGAHQRVPPSPPRIQ